MVYKRVPHVHPHHHSQHSLLRSSLSELAISTYRTPSVQFPILPPIHQRTESSPTTPQIKDQMATYPAHNNVNPTHPHPQGPYPQPAAGMPRPRAPNLSGEASLLVFVHHSVPNPPMQEPYGDNRRLAMLGQYSLRSAYTAAVAQARRDLTGTALQVR